MNVRFLLTVALILAEAGCAGTPSADQRRAAANDLNPSGRPYVGPPGTLSSAPPADTSFNRLYCHQEFQGSVCTRSRQVDSPESAGGTP